MRSKALGLFLIWWPIGTLSIMLATVLRESLDIVSILIGMGFSVILPLAVTSVIFGAQLVSRN